MTTAELISTKFVRIGESHTVAEVVGVVFDPESSSLREIVVVVLGPDGAYSGLIEPRDILESLCTELSAAGDDAAEQVGALRRGLAVSLSDIARRNIPAAKPTDNLATLLSIASRTDTASIPVFDKRQFLGVVTVTSVFDAVCKLTVAMDEAVLPFMSGNPARK